MNRRELLKLAGGFAMSPIAQSVLRAEPGDPPFIDRKRLHARNQNRSTVVCQHGLVCASQPLAAMAGIDILKAGGNCIDAAICTNAALGVTEPASNGIGGDLSYGWNYRAGPTPRRWVGRRNQQEDRGEKLRPRAAAGRGWRARRLARSAERRARNTNRR